MGDLQLRMYDFARDPSKQSKYAGRISRQQWETAKPVIIDMFRRGLTRREMIEQLRDQHNFRPSMSQLVTQVMRWGLTRDKARADSEVAFVPSPWNKIDPQLYLTHLCSQPQISWEFIEIWDPLSGEVSKQSPSVQKRLHDFVFSPTGGARDWELAYFNRMAEGDPPAWIALCRRMASMSKAFQNAPTENGCLIARDFIIHSLQIGLRSNSKELQYDIALVYGMMYLAADATKRSNVEEAQKHVEAACTIFQGTLFYRNSGNKKVMDVVVDTLKSLEPPAFSGSFNMDFETFIADPMATVTGPGHAAPAEEYSIADSIIGEKF